MGIAMDDKTKTIADRFRAMADAIELNGTATFGGAFVVIPPFEGGDLLETLILDNRQDASQFWIFLKTKSQTQMDDLDGKNRLGQSFGRR